MDYSKDAALVLTVTGYNGINSSPQLPPVRSGGLAESQPKDSCVDIYIKYILVYVGPFPNPCGYSELRSCVKVEVAVLGSPSLTSFVVSMGVKQQ